MMDMMQTCWHWMMGLGWIGILLGLVGLVLLMVLVVVLIRRTSRKGRS